MKRSALTRKTPLRRSRWIRIASGSTSRPTTRRRHDSLRSRVYLKFIRGLPCSVDGCSGKSQAAHTGNHGYAQKASDWQAIPLCAEHHPWEFSGSWHRLERRYGLSVDGIVQKLLELFAR